MNLIGHALAIALPTAMLVAQTPELGLTIGAALTTNTSAGAHISRQFVQVAVNAGWTLAAGHDLALVYVPALIPVAITTHDANYQYVPPPPCTGNCIDGVVGGTSVVTYHTVYGAGLTPLGLDLHILRHSPVSIVVGGDGGALWFTRAVPKNDAAKFNFVADGRAGLQFRTSRHLAVRLGYEYHHTSNAGSGATNPGLNSSMLIVGIVRQ